MLNNTFNCGTRTARRHASGSRKSARAFRGFSMIEVLVVMLILSFGMLGIASLQANTAKFKINSWARSAASVQFSDLADRVRANPTQAGSSFSQTGSGTSASGYALASDWETQQAATLSITTNCMTTECTAAERATYDMLVWRAGVRRMFPQGAAIVAGNRSAGMTASIAWFDRQFTQADGSLDRSAVCTVGATGAVQANCCPVALGDPAPQGVRCTNISFLP